MEGARECGSQIEAKSVHVHFGCPVAQSLQDHLQHVRTQWPYALLMGAVAVVCGTLRAGFGVSPWWLLGVGLLVCAGLLWLLGKPSRGRVRA